MVTVQERGRLGRRGDTPMRMGHSQSVRRGCGDGRGTVSTLPTPGGCDGAEAGPPTA